MKQHFFCLFILFFSLPLFTQSPPPTLHAESAILVSVASGQVLFEKNADRLCPPASMTKLVTVYTALRLWQERGYRLETVFTVPAAADFRNMPPHSSLMFLQTGQKVTLRELLLGLMIPSGNDAATATALSATDSTAAFVDEMNRAMQQLGLNSCRFTEPSGYSDKNEISPREFAYFCVHLIQTYPEILEITSLPQTVYPQTHNLNGTVAVYGSLRQSNHNELVGVVPEVDGLKTGYIEVSGNNVALTAERDGTRFVAVLTGIHDSDSFRRSSKRTVDGSRLLAYAFENFCDYRLLFAPLRNTNGKTDFVEETVVTLDRRRLSEFKIERTAHQLILKQAGVVLKTSEIGKKQAPRLNPFFNPAKTTFDERFELVPLLNEK